MKKNFNYWFWKPYKKNIIKSVDKSNFQIEYIYNRSKIENKEFAEFGLNSKVFNNNFNSLSKLSKSNFYYIGLPNHLHEEYIKKIGNLKNKIILCEKPSFISLNKVKKMINYLDANNSYLFECFMYLYSEQYLKIISLLNKYLNKDYTIFDINFCFPKPDKGNFRVSNYQGSGSFFDTAVYPISFIYNLFKNKKILKIISHDRLKNSKQDIGYIRLKHNNLIFNVKYGFGLNYTNNLIVNSKEFNLNANFIFSKPLDRSPKISFVYKKFNYEYSYNHDNQFVNMFNFFSKFKISDKAKFKKNHDYLISYNQFLKKIYEF